MRFPALFINRESSEGEEMNLEKFVRVAGLSQMLSVSRSTIWRWVNTKHDFPQPVRLTKGVTVWSVEEINNWIEKNVNKK